MAQASYLYIGQHTKMATFGGYTPPSRGGQYSGFTNVGVGVVRYLPLNTSNTNSATEALAQSPTIVRTFNELKINTSTFTFGGTIDVVLRVNGASTALTQTISGVGVTTVVVPVTVADNDLINLMVDSSASGGGTARIHWELT